MPSHASDQNKATYFQKKFGLPVCNLVTDTSFCRCPYVEVVLHRQPADISECHRPPTSEHQLVLYRGTSEHGEVSFGGGTYGRYSKHDNEWYLAPAGRNESSWRWSALPASPEQEAVILRVLIPESAFQTVREATLSKGATEDLPLLTGIHDDFMSALADQLRTEMLSPGPCGRTYTEALTSTLCLYLIRRYSGRCESFPGNTGQITFSEVKKKRIKEYVTTFLHHDLSLSDMAEVVAMSPFHFSRVFRNTFGIPPHQYLLRVRMFRLAELLRETDAPLDVLCEQVGYRYPNSLISIFRRYSGLTPIAYRKQYCRSKISTVDR